MFELLEVEVVYRGLENHLKRREIGAVTVLHPRPMYSHPAGPKGFVSDLTSWGVDAVARRGRYLWLILDDDAIIAHLGMSKQFRVNRLQDPQLRNMRVLSDLDDGTQLRFVDQYVFGGLEFVRGGGGCPVLYIALDPFDPGFDPAAVACRTRTRHTMVKRTILDQESASRIGNIYADESLWRAKLHLDHPIQYLAQTRAVALLRHVHDVMSEAPAVSDTSFDSLYVNVNDELGYSERGFSTYGRKNQPRRRYAAPVVH